MSATVCNIVRAPGPIIKYCGGKTQLLPEIRRFYPEKIRHYYEPFFGGGAVFFDLRAGGWDGEATLGDANERLVRTYLGIRNDVQDVIDRLREMKYDRDVFYEERERRPEAMSDDADVAAWFIYLNRCGFNGLYRVNKSGKFNVPFGRYTNPKICDPERLIAASLALRGTEFRICDFGNTVRGAEAEDFVYFDPPYLPTSETANFTSYTASGFPWDDQIRLRDCALRLKGRGVNVLLSNAGLAPIRDLYADGFDIHEVQARRNINSDGGKRGNVTEFLIT